MSRSLLYTVQRVLEKLDLDSVNDISQTVDSSLIAREAESTFIDLVTRHDWPELFKLITLNNVSDLTNPTAVILPDDVVKIECLRYKIPNNTDPTRIEYRVIKWLDPKDFLDLIYTRDSSADNVLTTDISKCIAPVAGGQLPSSGAAACAAQGGTWDLELQTCICPFGQFWDSTLQACILIPT